MKPEIVICMGSSCFARGNKTHLTLIEKYLNERALTDKVDLIGSCCEGACDKGPNIKINGRAFHGVDEGALLDLLDREFGHLTVEGDTTNA